MTKQAASDDAAELNRERAACGEAAVKAYSAVKEHNTTDLCDFSSEDGQERLTDLLADLRHWAWREGMEFAEADRISAVHFEAEVAEEGEEKPTAAPTGRAVEDELAEIGAQAPPEEWEKVGKEERLAAVAPELLAACKAALNHLEGDEPGLVGDVAEILRQAIDKAEGGAS